MVGHGQSIHVSLQLKTLPGLPSYSRQSPNPYHIPHGSYCLPPVLHTSCAACGRAASPGRSWNVLVCLHLPPLCLLHHPSYPMAPSVTFRILLNVTCLVRPSLSTLVWKNCATFPYTCCPSSLPYFSLFDISLKLKLLFLFIVCFSAPEGKAQEGKVVIIFSPVSL